MKLIKIFIATIILGTFPGCQKYLDVVPDNVATIENAFTLRSSAEKYLFTCYSYLPRHGHFDWNPAFNAGDEVWYMFPSKDINVNFWNIARGNQNSSNPLGAFWEGINQGEPLFIALRDCNIFLDNIHKVPDMDRYEKEKWKAEATFLKAYFHFYLLRMYGPIPLVRTNLPISSSTEDVKVFREPFDTCVNYIVQLLDEADANEQLPDNVSSATDELGRINRAIVKAFKAKVLVTAASPLFNGNVDYAGFKDKRGTALFSPSFQQEKWVRAANACKDAIEFCHAQGYKLYTYTGPYQIDTEVLPTQLSIRGSATDKENNQEVIWPNGVSRSSDMQRWAMPLINAGTSGSGPKGILAPPLKMAELFYTKNGVPIEEDKDWQGVNPFLLRKAVFSERFLIKAGEETVQLHFDREPRFYANLGFDRGIWHGNWANNYDTLPGLATVRARKGETAARQGISNFSGTGYWIKKLVSLQTTAASDGALTYSIYPWPEMRLADLYLMYSEALNEVNGPGEETMHWIDQVRARAGLQSVEASWTAHAVENAKFATKEGLRDIIQRERLIELAFEGQRFWDLRRWKKSHIMLNTPIKGWDIEQVDPASYYKEVLLYNQTFYLRDYLWPISVNELLTNRNLVQNPGW